MTRHQSIAHTNAKKRSIIVSNETPRNIIGPLIRELRETKGWTQADLARELRLLRSEISETDLARIEARELMVKDFETLYLLTALQISQQDFWRRLAEKPPGLPGQEGA